MNKLKSDKYIITESGPWRPELADIQTRVIHLNNDTVKGAFEVGCWWIKKDSDKNMEESHSHDYDEILAFIGTDSKHPRDLGGEIEFWIDGEKQILTKSCVVYIPKGTIHCPLFFRKVNRPIFHFGTMPVGMYQRHKDK